MWDGQFPVFAEHFRGIRDDTRAFGKSVTADVAVGMWVGGPGHSPDGVALRLRERVGEMILSNYTTHRVEGQPVVLDPPAAGRLAEIRVPTLVVLGDLDETGVLRAAEAIAN